MIPLSCDLIEMPPERRADLLFRAKNPGAELQLHELKWTNIDEVMMTVSYEV